MKVTSNLNKERLVLLTNTVGTTSVAYLRPNTVDLLFISSCHFSDTVLWSHDSGKKIVFLTFYWLHEICLYLLINVTGVCTVLAIRFHLELRHCLC